MNNNTFNFSYYFIIFVFCIFSSTAHLVAYASDDLNLKTNSTETGKNIKPSIGVALGAGGANGLAHIVMLEALDEMAIEPQCIAGSSIGSIIGALYASGIKASEIRKLVEQFIISSEEKVFNEFLEEDTLRWLEFIDIEIGKGGLLSSDGFISYLYDTLKKDTFSELEIPLKIVAADLWKREQVVLSGGPLLPAVKASMAIPGVFEPVTLNERVLIDGGTMNPVPYELLLKECDIIIAIDVSGERSTPNNKLPGYFETLFNSIDVMHKSIMNEKLKRIQPDIYIVPTIIDVRSLEFYKSTYVFKQAIPAKQELKHQLTQILKQYKKPL